MIRGLYTAAAGMTVTQKQSETIAENLDNARNPGYMEKQANMVAFPTMLMERLEGKETPYPPAQMIGTMGTGVMVDTITYRTAPGQIQTTNSPTDMALDQGFFVVQTLAGERYTRDGHFALDGNGMLRTDDGNLVLGEKGAIGPLSKEFTVDLNGTIWDNGQAVDRLRVVDIPGTALQKEGQTTFYAATQNPTPVNAENIRVRQGLLEESNVDLNSMMVKMISVMRSYEANQKVIQNQDDILGKAVNEIGKI